LGGEKVLQIQINFGEETGHRPTRRAILACKMWAKVINALSRTEAIE
jgi:hypothetical protein